MATTPTMRYARILVALCAVVMLANAAEAGRWIAPGCTACPQTQLWAVFLTADAGDTEAAARALTKRHGGYVHAVWTTGEKKYLVEATEAEARALLADPKVTLVDGRQERYTRAPRSSRPVATTEDAERRTWSSGEYRYDGAGNIKSIGLNNTYSYDRVGRLTSATVRHGTEIWSQTLGYDVFGNRIRMTTGNGGVTGTPTIIVDPSTNRLQSVVTPEGVTTSYAYDAAGNMIVSGATTFTYDALGMAVTRGGSVGPPMRYLYTADDERIVSINTASNERLYTLRGPDQKVLREYERAGSSGALTWTKDYVWRGGQLLASYGADGATRHYHLDHLGTPRLVTDGSGNEVSEHTYLPFGEELSAAGPERMKFTGHERDQGDPDNPDNLNFADLDYMHARYYNPNLGRFLSTDPGKDWNPKGPQSWNLYAYVRNNPIRFTDPDGREHVREPGFTKPLSEAGDWSQYPAVSWAFYAQGALLLPATADYLGVGRVYGAVRSLIRAAPEVSEGTSGTPAAVKGGGRAKNKLEPDPSAQGAHTTIKRNANGEITNYATYSKNDKNPAGFQEFKRVDVKGSAHRNPDGTSIPTPHVNGVAAGVGKRTVRPALPQELPGVK